MGATLSWETPAQTPIQPTWLSAQSAAQLAQGVFAWDFAIEVLAERQIGVGVMLAPPDWGFFGYLGAGKGAWSYDAYEGAIVTETEAIHADLPKFSQRGVVSVYLDLKNEHACTFSINDTAAPAIELPEGSTIVPAACLLKIGQVVTLRNYRQIE